LIRSINFPTSTPSNTIKKNIGIIINSKKQKKTKKSKDKKTWIKKKKVNHNKEPKKLNYNAKTSYKQNKIIK
jgi:hypothetical protein